MIFLFFTHSLLRGNVSCGAEVFTVWMPSSLLSNVVNPGSVCLPLEVSPFFFMCWGFWAVYPYFPGDDPLLSQGLKRAIVTLSYTNKTWLIVRNTTALTLVMKPCESLTVWWWLLLIHHGTVHNLYLLLHYNQCFTTVYQWEGLDAPMEAIALEGIKLTEASGMGEDEGGGGRPAPGYKSIHSMQW